MNLTNVSNISQTCSVDGIFGEFPLGVFAKVTTVLTFFLNRLGSILFLGLVHYEKFGQDSQKRHVTDRIFSFNILLFLFCYLIRDIIITVRIFAGVLGNAMGLLGVYLASTMLAIPLGFAEIILLRCIRIFSWRNYAMMNDEFFATFLILFNMMIIQMFSIIRLKNDELEVRFEYKFISGICYNINEDTR